MDIKSAAAFFCVLIPLAQADTDMVILGGILNEDCTINSWTKARVDKGAEIARSTAIRQIILSGKGPRQKTEAQAMSEYLEMVGIDKKRLKKEEMSMNTFGNALYTYKYLASQPMPEELIVITNDFHMERALMLFKFVFANTKTQIVAINIGNNDIAEAELTHRKEQEETYVSCFKKIILPVLPAGDIFGIEKLLKGESKEVLNQFNICRKI